MGLDLMTTLRVYHGNIELRPGNNALSQVNGKKRVIVAKNTDDDPHILYE